MENKGNREKNEEQWNCIETRKRRRNEGERGREGEAEQRKEGGRIFLILSTPLGKVRG